MGKIPWRKKWKPNLVFLPGTSHGFRSLAGYSPWGCKESNTTEVTAHAACLEMTLIKSPGKISKKVSAAVDYRR